MKAAVVLSFGVSPSFTDFREPEAGNARRSCRSTQHRLAPSLSVWQQGRTTQAVAAPGLFRESMVLGPTAQVAASTSCFRKHPLDRWPRRPSFERNDGTGTGELIGCAGGCDGHRRACVVDCVDAKGQAPEGRDCSGPWCHGFCGSNGCSDGAVSWRGQDHCCRP